MLRISAIAAVIISIWPYAPVASPRFFKTGRIMLTEVVAIIRAIYQLFLTLTRSDNPMAAAYDKIIVRQK